MDKKQELIEAGIKVLKILYPLLILLIIYLFIALVGGVFAIGKFMEIQRIPTLK